MSRGVRSPATDGWLDEVLYTALAIIDAAVIVTDAEGRVTLWNSSAEELFGWSAVEAAGELARELIVPSSRLDDATEIRHGLADGHEWSGRFLCRRRDGSLLPVRVVDVPIMNSDGKLAAIVATCTDITSVVTAERDGRALQAVSAAGERVAEDRFGALLARSSELVVVVDEEGIVRSTGPTRDELAPSPEQPTAGYHIGDLVHAGDRAVVVDAHARVVSGEEAHPVVVYRRLTSAGEVRWREAMLTNLLDEPLVRGVVFNVRDVTEREVALQQLRTSEAQFRAVVNRSSDVAVFFEMDGTIRWASPAIRDVFGLDPDALVGYSGFDLVHPLDRARVIREIAEGLPNTGDHVTVEYRITDPLGRERWVEDIATNLLDDPDVGYIVANLRDITDRKAGEDELRRLARFDDLTGLPNRTQLLEVIEQHLHRSDGTTRCGLVFIDVDDFCDVNDTLGHRVGDELLRGLAARIERALGPDDALARFGGDEFAVFCPEVDDLPACLTVAERIRDVLDAPFVIEGNELFAAVSIGVAMGPLSAETLISNADTALYRAKRSGRAQTLVFESAHGAQTAQRLHYIREIRRALERDEIVPQYQPVVDLATGTVVAVEALARWHHAERGPIPPDVFISVAESSGLISELGAAVLRHSCADAVVWAQAGRRLQIAVNASAVELVDQMYPFRVDEALRSSGLAADCLSIEITETAALRDVDAATATLNHLRDRGIVLALDDFGTGYSSLAFLKRLPVGALKIDRSFVSGIGVDRDDERIVAGVVQLGLALGFNLVAEGVETDQQADHLRVMGCHYGQGFLWSPAVPADDLMATIARIEASLPKTQ